MFYFVKDVTGSCWRSDNKVGLLYCDNLWKRLRVDGLQRRISSNIWATRARKLTEKKSVVLVWFYSEAFSTLTVSNKRCTPRGEYCKMILNSLWRSIRVAAVTAGKCTLTVSNKGLLPRGCLVFANLWKIARWRSPYTHTKKKSLKHAPCAENVKLLVWRPSMCIFSGEWPTEFFFFTFYATCHVRSSLRNIVSGRPSTCIFHKFAKTNQPHGKVILCWRPSMCIFPLLRQLHGYINYSKSFYNTRHVVYVLCWRPSTCWMLRNKTTPIPRISLRARVVHILVTRNSSLQTVNTQSFAQVVADKINTN